MAKEWMTTICIREGTRNELRKICVADGLTYDGLFKWFIKKYTEEFRV